MVKRVVDTSFWTDMQVIDNYSVEDKYFSLYLMTNNKTTQVGIYALPKKVISFETGFTSEVIQVLLDRFNEKYNKILYSEKTQEVTVLHSLQYTILKGGTPVSDLMERELSKIKDSSLILATYNEMKSFWEVSKRKFDKTIQSIFENELTVRGLFFPPNVNENQNHNDNDIYDDNDNENHNDNDNDNDNDNEESGAMNRTTNQSSNRATIQTTNRAITKTDNQAITKTDALDADELNIIKWYSDYLKKYNPKYSQNITPDNIVLVYYEQVIGKVSPHVKNQLVQWQQMMSRSLVLEALHRSVKANNPFVYVTTIIDSWIKSDVKNYEDVIKLDKYHNQRM